MSPRMRVDSRAVVVCAFVLISICTPNAQRAAPAMASAHAVAGGIQLPMVFERNDGQSAARVRFTARGAGYVFALTDAGIDVRLQGDDVVGPPKGGPHVQATFGLHFSGSDPHPIITGESPLAGRAHYIVGSNPATWRTEIPTFARVRYQDVWSGIDAVVYGNERQLEYDLVVAAGADPSQARILVAGAEAVEVAAGGELTIRVAGQSTRFSRPIAYQDLDGEQRMVAAEYVVDNRTLAFRLGEYDRARPLVIDPVLHYSTFLGGSEHDRIADVAIDAAGNVYVTGTTGSSDFPTTPGAYDTVGAPAPFQALAFVSKLNPAGTALIYSTYIGASDSTGARSIAVDAGGNAYVTGTTEALDFPTRNAVQATNQAGGECECDGFVLKLAPGGNALVYSTFLGGSNDDITGEIAVDPTGEAVVVGRTWSTNFPTANAADPTYGGGPDFEEPSDGFATKFNRSGASLIYSTYLHGGAANAVALDASGRAYVGGENSRGTLVTTAGAAQTTYAGQTDGVLVRLSASGAWQFATYLGGTGFDAVQGVAVDAAGTAYLAIHVSDGGFPTTADAWQPTAAGSADVVVAKVTFAGRLTYASYFGGPDGDFVSGIDVDPWGRATVVGTTYGNVPVTVDAFQPSPKAGIGTAFIATLEGPFLRYATYLGGSVGDGASAVAIHQTGRITVVGGTQSSNFPLRNALDSTCGGTQGCSDGFIAQFLDRPPGTLPPGSVVVLHARSAGVVSGAWRFVNDSTAAGGMRLEHPDMGAAKIVAPLANPTDYVELTANVVPGRPYVIWIRGKAQGNSYNNDSVYVQYSNLSTASSTPVPLIGSTTAQAITLEDCANCGLNGWGWQDPAYGLNVMAAPLTGFTSTTTTIRIQTREDGFAFDQVMLIRDDRSWAPGFQKQDATIYSPVDPTPLSEIVLYPGVDGTADAGGWHSVADASAAGGAHKSHPNANAAKITAPLASPTHYFDLSFDAEANVAYYFYLRGKAEGNDPYNDSVYVQLSNTPWAPGTASALSVNLEVCAGAGLSGWGWRDTRWCDADTGGRTVTFAIGGRQNIRVQTREDGMAIDQIVLSQSRTQPPGPAKNDTTIVPR